MAHHRDQPFLPDTGVIQCCGFGKLQIFLAFAVFLLSVSCATSDRAPSPQTKPGLPPTQVTTGIDSPIVCFGQDVRPTTGPELRAGEGPFTADLQGKTVSLGGQLHDTSEIDVFHPNIYDGFRIYSERLYVKDRVYQSPLKSVWCIVQARVSKVDEKQQDQNEIAILKYEPIDMRPVNEGLEQSVSWVEANRAKIDMNQLKADPDFARTLGKLPVGKKDINLTPFQLTREVTGVDPVRGFAQFFCGQYVLEEVLPHHAHYATVSAVYDLKQKRIIRIIIARGVHWEE